MEHMAVAFYFRITNLLAGLVSLTLGLIYVIYMK